ERTMAPAAAGSSEGWFTLCPVESCWTAVATACSVCCMLNSMPGMMLVTRMVSSSSCTAGARLLGRSRSHGHGHLEKRLHGRYDASRSLVCLLVGDQIRRFLVDGNPGNGVALIAKLHHARRRSIRCGIGLGNQA